MSKALTQAVARLHAIEEDLETANALEPDPRLTDAEIAVRHAIYMIEFVAKNPGPGETWDCAVCGHKDDGSMFYGHCKYCGVETS